MPSISFRQNVEVTQHEQLSDIVDNDTGLRLTVEGIELVSPRAVALGTEVTDALSNLGLLDEPITLAEVRRRQSGVRREALDQQRLTQWQDLLEFACAEIPYFSERAATYQPSSFNALTDVSRLPLMRKADIRANFPDRLVASSVDVKAGVASGLLELVATSGTTGERLEVLFNHDIDSLPDHYEKVWDLTLEGATPRTAVLTTPVCMGAECHLGKMPFEKRLRQEHTLFLNSTVDLFSIPRASIENIAEELNAFRPDLLMVNPFYMHWVARCAREWGIALHRPRVILSSYQYLSALQRRALTAMFGAPVFDFHSATDLGGLRTAVECSRGHVHVRCDHCDVEVLRGGAPAPAGELGTLVITGLANRVMPVVRYVVGDVASWVDEPCDCPLSDWPSLALHGRLKDLLWLDDRWVSTRQIDDAVSTVDHIDFYRCEQVAPAHLVIQVVPALGMQVDAAALVDALRSRWSVSRVDVKPVSRLDPEVSLKYRLTQGHVRPAPELL